MLSTHGVDGGGGAGRRGHPVDDTNLALIVGLGGLVGAVREQAHAKHNPMVVSIGVR